MQEIAVKFKRACISPLILFFMAPEATVSRQDVTGNRERMEARSDRLSTEARPLSTKYMEGIARCINQPVGAVRRKRDSFLSEV